MQNGSALRILAIAHSRRELLPKPLLVTWASPLAQCLRTGRDTLRRGLLELFDRIFKSPPCALRQPDLPTFLVSVEFSFDDAEMGLPAVASVGTRAKVPATPTASGASPLNTAFKGHLPVGIGFARGGICSCKSVRNSLLAKLQVSRGRSIGGIAYENTVKRRCP